ncbi:UNKNOWN [Stylonychia lemnae]|uniref:Uncharacterized protein n=1 Tax=Stylonychia lemnae TaxID=5949 RepID=A0A078A4D7_STYLE|nr:UNKNOWN [Stylonychia lemnae]|eukprot:CDW77118.1 UNKNOWN [Stylonychia lemnae]
MSIQNSTFIRGMSREQGGALLIQNTNFNIRFSNFIENYAKDGGAMALICSPLVIMLHSGQKWQVTLIVQLFKVMIIFPWQVAKFIKEQQKLGSLMLTVRQSQMIIARKNQASQSIFSSIYISATDQNAKISGEYQIQVENGIGIFQIMPKWRDQLKWIMVPILPAMNAWRMLSVLGEILLMFYLDFGGHQIPPQILYLVFMIKLALEIQQIHQMMLSSANMDTRGIYVIIVQMKVAFNS